MDIIQYLPHFTWWSILLAMIPLPIFWYFKRFNLIQLLLGVVALFIAYFIELGEEFLLGESSLLLMLVFLAPVIEELSKFFMTIYKKNEKSAVGVGMGFTIIENAMYYTAFASTVGLPMLLLFREFQDPILHTSTTSVSVKSWKGYPYILIAIGMHSLYNFIAIYDNLTYSVIISIVYASILGYMIHKDRVKK